MWINSLVKIHSILPYRVVVRRRFTAETNFQETTFLQTSKPYANENDIFILILPGAYPSSLCFNKSMNAQAEYKAKARFLALLRRCRLWSAAQWSLVSELVLSFRHCKGKPIIPADYYKKWHVPFIVQSLATFVQLFVQVLAFWPCSKHLSAALQRFFA